MTRTFEGVPYTRHRIYYTLLTPQGPIRRRMVRWLCPIIERGRIAQELDDRFGIENIQPRSVTVQPC